MTKSQRQLAFVLRLFGAVDLLALAAVVLPRDWMAAIHAWAGLGTMPDGTVVGYLARSASAMYVLHGALVIYVSFDVSGYARLIRFLAVAALAHGAIVLGVDLWEGMPHAWTVIEGPGFAATGAVVLWLHRTNGESCATTPL